jgi:hypothetical protein
VKARFRTSAGHWSDLAEVTFNPAPIGDYDGDHMVSGHDFLVWQQQLGSPATPSGSGADGNYDGLVNASDLAVWRGKFGTAYPAAAPLSATALSASAASLDAAYTALAAYDEITSQNENPPPSKGWEQPSTGDPMSPERRAVAVCEAMRGGITPEPNSSELYVHSSLTPWPDITAANGDDQHQLLPSDDSTSNDRTSEVDVTLDALTSALELRWSLAE